MRPSKLTKCFWLPYVVLAALLLSAYASIFGARFIWDDDVHIINNIAVTSKTGIFQIWTTAQALYYPLTSTVFWGLHKLFGANPVVFHTCNITLHFLNALLLFKILRKLRFEAAWLAVFFFALHPVQTETVAWATELKNILSAFFFFASISAYLNWHEKKALNNYTLFFLFFTLSILSKPAAIMFPLLILIHRRMSTKESYKKILVTILPLLLICIPYGLWTIWEQLHHSGAIGKAWELPFGDRIAISGNAFWFYLGKLIWPYPLSFIYERWDLSSSGVLKFGGVFFFGILAMLIRKNKTEVFKTMRASLIFYLAMLFPTLSLFNIYFFRFSFVSDHFQYLACIGPLTFFAYLLNKHRAVAFLTVFSLWVLSSSYVPRFKSSESLWLHTVKANPKAWLAHNNLGNHLMDRMELLNALSHYQISLQLNPDFAEAHANIGTALSYTDKPHLALPHFQKAIELQPGVAANHNGIAIIYSLLNQQEEALENYRLALEIDPLFEPAKVNLAKALKEET